jgi:hypothetical protein
MFVYNCLASACVIAFVCASTIPPSSNVASRQVAGTPTLAIQQLVAGIGFNIMAQQGEVAVASIMQNLGTAPTPDAALFKAAKVNPLSDV